MERPLDTLVQDKASSLGSPDFLFCVDWIGVGEDGGGCNILKYRGEP